MKNIVILISGSGSNMKSIVNHFKNTDVNIKAIISNKSCKGIDWAIEQNIPNHIIESKGLAREEFDTNLLQCVQQYNPDLVVLAGFMRILTDVFISPLLGKLINIHPSLLPKYKGLNTHKSAIDAKEKFHGASVHFVTTELDSGPIILQANVPVLKNDNQDTLAKRVLEIEHIIYPKAIQMILEGKIIYTDLI